MSTEEQIRKWEYEERGKKLLEIIQRYGRKRQLFEQKDRQKNVK